MLRTLKNLFKQDREKFVVPKSVQNVIPIKTIWDDGIFLVGRNKNLFVNFCFQSFFCVFFSIKRRCFFYKFYSFLVFLLFIIFC